MNLFKSRKFAYGIPVIAVVATYFYTQSTTPEMLKSSTIRAANAAFAAKKVTGPVAVFVGGTSGIGEAAMKKFTQHTVSPTIYFVGRNEAAATQITATLHALNPSAKVSFIKSDLTLLSNAEAVASQIKEKESHINLLFISSGYLSMDGRTPTPEGLEKKLVINYYSRALFVSTFISQLSAAATTSSELGARVISVFSAGMEGPIIENDMDLEHSFSLSQAAKQASAFTSLAFDHLATLYPNIGWVHAYPGLVMTGIAREMPLWGRALMPLFSPVSVNIEDSGHGFLRLSTDKQYKTGLALVDWRGKNVDRRHGGSSWLGGSTGWWKDGLPEKVWAYTGEVFEKVLGKKAP